MPRSTGHGKNKWWWIYSNMFKQLPLSFMDFYCKRDFLVTTCVATTGDQGKLPHFMYFPWLPVEVAIPIFSFFFFRKGINKNNGGYHQCQIISFIKMWTLKRSFLQLIDHDIINRSFHIYIWCYEYVR